MIAIIDYGMGNLGSVAKALHHVGCAAEITSDAHHLEQAAGLVLPGVGAFDDCIRGLREHDLVGPICELVTAGKPFLGICLGLQMLFAHSEEGSEPGLGLLAGEVVRFRHDLKVPQIGWNQVSSKRPAPHIAGIADQSWFYFVHSYYVVPEDESVIATTTDYGYAFCSAVWRDNLFACQFHPEKSQAVGLQLLTNFRDVVESA